MKNKFITIIITILILNVVTLNSRENFENKNFYMGYYAASNKNIKLFNSKIKEIYNSNLFSKYSKESYSGSYAYSKHNLLDFKKRIDEIENSKYKELGEKLAIYASSDISFINFEKKYLSYENSGSNLLKDLNQIVYYATSKNDLETFIGRYEIIEKEKMDYNACLVFARENCKFEVFKNRMNEYSNYND